MFAKLSTLPPLKYPLMMPGASKMKFYNLIDTTLLVLRVNCYSDVQNAIKSIDIELISLPFLQPYTAILGQISGSI